MKKNRRRGWAIARLNLYYENFGEAVSKEERAQTQVKIIDVMLDEEKAKKNVARLNTLNKTKNVVYFYQAVGIQMLLSRP